MNNVETEQNTFRVGKPFQLIFKARIATSLGHSLQTTLALDFSSVSTQGAGATSHGHTYILQMPGGSM